MHGGEVHTLSIECHICVNSRFFGDDMVQIAAPIGAVDQSPMGLEEVVAAQQPQGCMVVDPERELPVGET